jgi:1-acyl-sn-glycerol-3-phosphate acyltransferase
MRGKTGAARVALETRCPLIPVAQWGAQEILSPYARRISLFPRKTMMMYAGPPVDLSDLYERPLDTKVLREATDRLMDRITELLGELRGEERPTERFDPRTHRVPEVGDPLRHDQIGRRKPSPGAGDGSEGSAT